MAAVTDPNEKREQHNNKAPTILVAVDGDNVNVDIIVCGCGCGFGCGCGGDITDGDTSSCRIRE